MPAVHFSFAALTAAVLTAGLLALAGCDATDFDPFDRQDRFFSVYGFLDATRDTQFVRVVPVRDSIQAADGPIDAVVTLTDLTTGQAVSWRDSVFHFAPPRSEEGHVFWSATPILTEHTYRLDVARSDGAASSATVTVPAPPPPPSIEEVPSGPRIVRRARWPFDFNIAQVELVYHVRGTQGPAADSFEVAVPYAEFIDRAGSGVSVSFDLSRDFNTVYNAFGFPQGTPPARVGLLGLEIRLVRADAAWTFAGGRIPIETLAIPGLFTNVEHGFGFLGAATRTTFRWNLPPQDVALLGFTDLQPGDGAPGR